MKLGFILINPLQRPVPKTYHTNVSGIMICIAPATVQIGIIVTILLSLAHELRLKIAMIMVIMTRVIMARMNKNDGMTFWYL